MSIIEAFSILILEKNMNINIPVFLNSFVFFDIDFTYNL